MSNLAIVTAEIPVDLTPFSEPVDVEVSKWQLGGYKVKARFRINYRWNTACEFVETNRIFGHKGNLTDEELKKEFVKAISDIHEKRLFIFNANHGLLDTESKTVRFKA